MLSVHVESQIELARGQLPPDVEAELLRKTRFKDPLYKLNQARGLSTEGMTPTIETHTLSADTLSIWRGSLGMVVKTLRRHGVEYEIIDRRRRMPCRLPSHDLILRDYQQPAFEVMKKRHQTLFRGEAGSGKTETMLAAASHFGQWTLVLVWQERQQKVWLERVPRYFDCDVGGIGGCFKAPVYAPITIGMIQSVRNRLPELRGLFGCVLCDEVQRFAATTLREVVNNLPAAYRIGASDDERRRDGREFLLYSTFGPKGYQLRKGQGQCAVDIVAVPTRFSYQQRGWQINWPDLTESMADDRDRNALIANLACREARDGKRVLVWSDRVEHCETLKKAIAKRGVAAGLLLGTKQRKEEADATEAGLNDGSIMVGIGTKVAEQSVNIPPLKVGIMTCASADKKMYRFRQMRGRLARPWNDETARLYYLWDKKVAFLRGKINNIRRAGYDVKISRYDKRQKERERMASKEAVTLESMKAGAKAVGLKVPKGVTFKKLEQLIQRHLAKDKTFGSYACEQCGRDIVDEIPICPYCAGEFKPIADVEPEEPEEFEEEAAEEEEGEEEEGEGEEFEEEGEEEEGEEDEEGEYAEEDEEEGFEEEEAEEGEDGDEFEESDDEEGEGDEGDEGDEFEEEEEDVFEEEEEEPAPPKRKTKAKAKAKPAPEPEEEFEEEEEPAPAKKKASKKPTERQKAVAAGRAKRQATEAEREQKREQIRSELPYKKSDLVKMKRTALVMVASVLGIKNPISLGNEEAIITAIGKAQAKKFGKPSAKPAPAPAKKKVAKKKATRR